MTFLSEAKSYKFIGTIESSDMRKPLSPQKYTFLPLKKFELVFKINIFLFDNFRFELIQIFKDCRKIRTKHKETFDFFFYVFIGWYQYLK